MSSAVAIETGRRAEFAEVSEALERLLRIAPGGQSIVSCYLRLDVADRIRQRYFRELRGRIQRIEAQLDQRKLEREERLAVERDLARILRQVEDPNDLPHAHGLALFACEALELFLAIPLPRVHRSRIVLDDTPWVRELLEARHESGTIAVAVVDRREARFFEVTPQAANEVTALHSPAAWTAQYHADEQDAPGMGERAFHGRIREERHRHYASVVERLEVLGRQPNCRGVILAGPGVHAAALARFVPPRLASRVLGTLRLNPAFVTAADVQRQALALAGKRDAAIADRQVEDLRTKAGEGWATVGLSPTLAALGLGKVRTLFVGVQPAQAGFRCAATGRLVRTEQECRGLGDPAPVADLIDEAVEEALRQGAEVVTIPEGNFANSVAGIAALLRFR